MSRSLSHSDQVTANDQLAQHLELLHADPELGNASRHWHTTLLFYAAVHWVEEQLQQKNILPLWIIKCVKGACAKSGQAKRRRSVPTCNGNISHDKPAMRDAYLQIRISKTLKTISNT